MTVIPGTDCVEAPADLSARFREAMASYPSGVTIVTTADQQGRWWGFTATSFCSLSMRPPLVLMCLAKTAASYPAFLAAKSWVVHVVGFQHTDLARRFATTGIDKFAAGGFARNVNGDPVFGGASAVLECAAFAQHDGGDHTILIGEVTDAYGADPLPAIYFRRGYHTVAPDQYR